MFRLFSILVAVAIIGFLDSCYSFPPLSSQQSFALQASPVNVHLYVMATCPDAIFCEPLINEVLQQVGPLAQLEMDYIGTFLTNGTIKCKKGDCDIAAKELCLKKLVPEWFPILLCLNANIDNIRFPKTWSECARQLKVQLPIDDLDRCVKYEGTSLLRESVTRTLAAGATKSCSIYYNDVQRCIHDGSWYNCTGGTEVKDFVDDICKLSNDPEKSKYCRQ